MCVNVFVSVDPETVAAGRVFLDAVAGCERLNAEPSGWTSGVHCYHCHLSVCVSLFVKVSSRFSSTVLAGLRGLAFL